MRPLLAVEERIVEQLVKEYPLTDGFDLNLAVNKIRCRLITQAMADSKQNITAAAKQLNMIRTTLNNILVEWERKNEAKRTDSVDDLRMPKMAWGSRRRKQQRAID